jgi:hypothetical protein
MTWFRASIDPRFYSTSAIVAASRSDGKEQVAQAREFRMAQHLLNPFLCQLTSADLLGATFLVEQLWNARRR